MFITDIVPQSSGNVGNKSYDAGGVLLSCTTDTYNIRVSLLAVTGPSHLKPTVRVNGVLVTIVATSDPIVWTGYADITITGSVSIEAVHEDGDTCVCAVTYQAAPEVVSAIFTGGYPSAQTEVKAGDVYDVLVTSDTLMTGIEIQNYGAGTLQTFTFAATTVKTISMVVADRGTSPQLLSAQLRVKDAYGAYGTVYDTIVAGSVEGVNIIKLNNKYPVFSSIAQGNIAYPGSQAALKDSEAADVTCVCDIPGECTFVYSSPNGDLSIGSPTTYVSPKTVQRIAGSYNISTTNFRIVGTKTSNAASATVNGVVYIAHVACTLAVTEPAARLRSGGNAGTVAQNHTITVTASQRLLTAPTLAAPVGTWQGGGFAGGPTAWTRQLQIHDNDTKGTHAWGAISGTNLAGIITAAITGDANYVVGGFVFRTFYVAAWPNREGSIGTQVSDTAKLQCTNLSKGTSGSLNYAYQATTADTLDCYTITQPTGVANPTGNLFYNCDLPNSVSNTSGLLQIELSEEV